MIDVFEVSSLRVGDKTRPRDVVVCWLDFLGPDGQQFSTFLLLTSLIDGVSRDAVMPG